MRAMAAKRRQSTVRMSKIRPLLNERAIGCCERCGDPLPVNDDGTHYFEHHHRLKRTQGGGDGIENGLAVHPICHQIIHSHPASSRPLGLLLYAGQVPEDIPVSRAGQWVLLLPDGSVVETADPDDFRVSDPDHDFDIRCDERNSA